MWSNIICLWRCSRDRDMTCIWMPADCKSSTVGFLSKHMQVMNLCYLKRPFYKLPFLIAWYLFIILHGVCVFTARVRLCVHAKWFHGKLKLPQFSSNAVCLKQKWKAKMQSPKLGGRCALVTAKKHYRFTDGEKPYSVISACAPGLQMLFGKVFLQVTYLQLASLY